MQSIPVTQGAARRYEDLPGPPGIPVLGNAHQVQREVLHQQVEKWAREYGSVFRFRITSRRFLALADPELIASVLRQRPQSFQKGSRLVAVARDLGFPGVFSANGEAWRRQRQIVMSGLDPGHLRAFLPAIVDVTETLRQRWREAAREGRDIDLLADLMRYTVDVTTCLAFGRNADTLRKGDADAIQRHLNVIFPTLHRRIFAPVDLERWWPRRGLREHVAALREAVGGFIRQARAQLQEDPSLATRPHNLLQALVAACDGEAGALTDEELAGNVLTMLLAGEDTTANTLGWLIWLLHEHPSEWQKAAVEVDAVIGAGGVPRSLEELSRLDAVEACANEAMRLKPVAPINVAEAAEDVVVGDVQVPKGTFVMCVMRAPAVDDSRFEAPHEFRPSRWTHGEREAPAGVLSTKRVVMPFGAGPRVCPGRYLALAEIKMVCAMLLANFEVAAMKTPAGGPQEKLSLTMSPQGLVVRLRERA